MFPYFLRRLGSTPNPTSYSRFFPWLSDEVAWKLFVSVSLHLMNRHLNTTSGQLATRLISLSKLTIWELSPEFCCGKGCVFEEQTNFSLCIGNIQFQNNFHLGSYIQSSRSLDKGKWYRSLGHTCVMRDSAWKNIFSL